MPAPRPVNGGAEGLLTTPWIVKPSMTTLFASIWKAPSGAPTTDSLVRGTARVRASTLACAPKNVSVLFTVTSSGYIPGQTLIVSPGLAAPTAALIVGKAGVVALQSVALAIPSSSTTSVAAAAPGTPAAIRLSSVATRTPTRNGTRVFICDSLCAGLNRRGVANERVVR